MLLDSSADINTLSVYNTCTTWYKSIFCHGWLRFFKLAANSVNPSAVADRETSNRILIKKILVTRIDATNH